MNVRLGLMKKKNVLLPLVLVFFTTVLAACNNEPVPAEFEMMYDQQTESCNVA